MCKYTDMWRLGLVVLCVTLVAASPSVTRSREEIEEYKNFLELTQKDDGKTLEERMALNPNAKVWENSGKFQGDIVLGDEEIQGLLQDFAADSGTPESRNAYIWPNTRWPYNEVVWEFAGGHLNGWERDQVYRAIHEIEYHTCVRFRHRQSWDHNFVQVTGHNNGCYANVGFWNGRGIHTYNLGQGCFHLPIVIHEWLHILGFFHMQSTYNRYDYVRILWGNIQNGMAHNFDRYGNDLVSNLGLPYEYTSTMHYGSHAFSFNGHPTIEPTRHVNGVMGQQDYITWYDYLRVSRHYNCPGAWSAPVHGADEIAEPLNEAVDAIDAAVNVVNAVDVVDAPETS